MWAELTKRSGAGSLALFVGILLVVVIVGSLLSSVGPKLSPVQQAAEQKEEEAQQAAQQKEEVIKQKKEAEDNAKLLLAVIGAKTLRADMRNPDSFKLAQVLVMNDGSVCYEYRAQNGFGGMSLADAILTPKGTLKTSEESGFAPIWNRRCSNKIGKDATQEVGAATGIGTD